MQHEEVLKRVIDKSTKSLGDIFSNTIQRDHTDDIFSEQWKRYMDNTNYYLETVSKATDEIGNLSSGKAFELFKEIIEKFEPLKYKGLILELEYYIEAIKKEMEEVVSH